MKPTAVILTIWICCAGAAWARTWTNTQGRMIEAEMVAADDANVSLRLKNGSVVSVPLSSLGAMDQAFVRSQPKVALGGVPIEKRTWPDRVQVPQSEIEKVELVPGAGTHFIYRSPSFEFSSPAKLLPALIKEVARTFESTKRLIAALPWGIECKPPDGMERYLAALYVNRSDYVAAGGPENSGGVYMTKDKTFRIPFESLGIKKLGESYTRDVDFRNETLVHEITHQLMHDYLPLLPHWAAEGTAELTGMIPYKAGVFRVGSHEKGLKDYLGESSSRTPVKLARLSEILRMTSDEWSRQSLDNPSRQHELYRQAALLVYYFNFLDGDAPQQGHRWMRFMDAVRGECFAWDAFQKDFAGFLKKQDEFLKLPGVTKSDDGRIRYPAQLTPPLPPMPPGGENSRGPNPFRHLGLLLDARSEAVMEQDMAAKFSSIGIKTRF